MSASVPAVPRRKPKSDRVSFSSEYQSLLEVAEHHLACAEALRRYYLEWLPANTAPRRFAGYSPDDFRDELASRLQELDRASALAVLTAVEAALRIDYLWRSYRRLKDPLSRAFRELENTRGHRAGLEEDILRLWKQHQPESAAPISHLIGALKYRHWLAHGRYWKPKFGRKYDYQTVYEIADALLSELQLSETGA